MNLFLEIGLSQGHQVYSFLDWDSSSVVNSHIFFEIKCFSIFEAEDLLISADAPVMSFLAKTFWKTKNLFFKYIN